MNAPDRLRALMKSEPGMIIMPAVWDGLTAKLAYGAGFKTAFLSGSCVAASRLGGPDLDLVSFGEMFDSFKNLVRTFKRQITRAYSKHDFRDGRECGSRHQDDRRREARIGRERHRLRARHAH